MAPFPHRHARLLAVALALTLLVDCTVATWWQLGLSEPPPGATDMLPAENWRENCKLDFLSKEQRKLCQISDRILSAISIGAKFGIEECQHQFRHSRWNCSINQTPYLDTNSIPTTLTNNKTADYGTSIYGHVLKIQSRETAYIHAINAASVAFAVTRACTRGELSTCSCDKTPRTNKNWTWGGCNEDILYGDEFSRNFVDSVENSDTEIGLINLHNNEAGRRMIRSSMQRVCKCHGVSGSCTTRVCWRRLPSMRTVGEALGRKYEGASHVKVVQPRLGKKLKPLRAELKKPKKKDLVYLDDSPDYCERNDSLDIVGSRGRICNQTSHGLDGCRLLCCGRGYQTRIRHVVEKCKCKFIWCCNVQCAQCKKDVEEHVCN